MLFGLSAERAHLKAWLDATESSPVGGVIEGMPGTE
jgi:hypothetical protein